MLFDAASSIPLLYKGIDLCLIIERGIQVLILDIQHRIILTEGLPDLFPCRTAYGYGIFSALGGQYVRIVIRKSLRRPAVRFIEIFLSELRGIFCTSTFGTAGITLDEFNLKPAEQASECRSGRVGHLCGHGCRRILCGRFQRIVAISQSGNGKRRTLIISDIHTSCIRLTEQIFLIVRRYIIVCKYFKAVGSSFSGRQIMKYQLLTVSFRHLFCVQCNPGAVIKRGQSRIGQRINGNGIFFSVFYTVDLHPDFSGNSSRRSSDLLCQKLCPILVIELHVDGLGTDGLRIRIRYPLLCNGDRRHPFCRCCHTA